MNLADMDSWVDLAEDWVVAKVDLLQLTCPEEIRFRKKIIKKLARRLGEDES